MKTGIKWGIFIGAIALFEWAVLAYFTRHYTRRLFREYEEYTRAGKVYDIHTAIGKSDGPQGF